MLRDETTSINGQTTSMLSTGEEHYIRLNDLKDTGSSTVSAPPKYILRQINERKALNPNPLLSENGGGASAGGGLNRKKMKQSKLISSATTSSAAANLTKQQYAQQLAASSSTLANNTNSRLQYTNFSKSAALTHTNFASRMNEEFFQTFNNNNNITNHSNISQHLQINYPMSNSPANLYSSAFIAANTNTPIKTQLDKITGKQNGGGLINSASSPSFLTGSNSTSNNSNNNNNNSVLRQKINK
jgi:hypothetical protein